MGETWNELEKKMVKWKAPHKRKKLGAVYSEAANGRRAKEIANVGVAVFASCAGKKCLE
jgi:hypothetical protein